LEQNSSGKKIGAESAVLHFVFFIVIVNKMQQSAKENCLLKRNTMPEVFPLTAGIAGSGKTMPFEKRHAGCEERETDPDGKAATEFVMAVIQTDLSIPDPSDLNLLKWGGYVAAIGLTATVEYFAIKAIQSSISKAKEVLVL